MNSPATQTEVLFVAIVVSILVCALNDWINADFGRDYIPVVPPIASVDYMGNHVVLRVSRWSGDVEACPIGFVFPTADEIAEANKNWVRLPIQMDFTDCEPLERADDLP